MYSVQEICEEQERQYNQLMQEDDQYCHPESFKWGFEHGVEYALSKFGWHPGSELPPEEGEYIAINNGMPGVFWVDYLEPFGWCVEIMGAHEVVNVKWWIKPPKEK